jgi:histidine triad (HIT) family protein
MPDQDCLFCRIISGEAPARRVYESDTVVAFHDINPQAPTHILVVPRKHIRMLAEVGEDDRAIMGDLLLSARLIAEQEGIADGFRLVINNGRESGQSVFHIHLHLLGGRRMKWPPG